MLSGSGRDEKPSLVDLFSAPGGMSQGFSQAGFRVLATIDSDPWGCATLRQNFSLTGTKIIEADIQNLKLMGHVDVVAGGPPCQSFSQVGKAKINHLTRAGSRERFIDDNRNKLYKEFVRVVESLQPEFFVMENVVGIESYMEGTVKEEILTDFEKIGYSAEMNVLKAADFGVPQIRRRAIFIGNRLGRKNHFPKEAFVSKPDTLQTDLSPSLHGQWYRTVRDAISDLPSLHAGEGQDEMAYGACALTEYQKWARLGSDRVYNHVARNHSDRDIRLFEALSPGQKMTDLPKELIKLIPYPQTIFKDKIKKQLWDKPSYAIVAHMQKDGLMYIHPDPDQPRSFTPREAARIQSFRDTFRFMGPMTEQFRQIGNAVPPLLAQSIAEAIKPSIEPVGDPQLTWVASESSVKTELVGI